jgi:putative transposase
MAQTLVCLRVHVVFATKDRRPMITPEVESELYAYLGGTMKNLDSHCLAAGGTANHVHLLISQSKNMALSRLMEEIKKSSSKWIKTKGATLRTFGWQDGYGAFTIGQSQVEALQQPCSSTSPGKRTDTRSRRLSRNWSRCWRNAESRTTGAIYGREISCDPFRVGFDARGLFRGRCPRLLNCALAGLAFGERRTNRAWRDP